MNLAILLLVLICSAILTTLTDSILLRFFKKTGIANNRGNNGDVRWNSNTKPTVGGISFFITFVLAFLVYFLIPVDGGLMSRFGGDTQLTELLGLAAVITLAFFIGLSDDAFNTKPLLKFSGQVLAGVIMILSGVHIELFNSVWLDYPLTLLWVVGIMNSINLLDNMDGVTSTVSLTILLSVLAVIYTGSGLTAGPYAFIILAVTGSMIGFLVHNWKPAKIYMGDTGSQFLGALLAFLGVKFCWNITTVSEGGAVAQSVQVLVPLMAFIVPIMDTTFVTVARLMRKQSPFVGGKDHLTHHLSYIGVPEPGVPALLGLFSLLSGGLAVFTRGIDNWAHTYSTIFSGYLVIAFITFFILYKRGERIGLIKERFSRTLNRLEEEKRAPKVRKKEKQGQRI